MTDSSPRRSRIRAGAAAQLLVLLVGAGVFVGTLDQTVVVTLLPDMIRDLQLPVSRFGQMTWVVNGYLLGFTVAMPVVGRLADVFGQIRIFLGCLAIFVAGSAAVAMAPNLELLVVARSFQAIGGGGVLPVGMAIAASTISGRRRSVVLGALAATNNASSLIGPVWGAVLAGSVGWRGVFWLNIPLIVPIAIMLALVTREALPARGDAPDWWGALLLTAGLAALTIALTDDGANPRPLPVSMALAGIAVCLLAAWIRVELRARRPMIPLRNFAKAHFSAAMLMYFLIGGALIVALVSVPLMTNVLFKQPSLRGGLNLMRLLLLLPIGGVVGGVVSAHIGYRPAAVAGLVMASAGFLIMSRWQAVPSGADLWLALGLIGFGMGLCDAPIVSTVFDSIQIHERATSAALLLVAWTCGMIVGLALLGTRGLGSFSAEAARLFREQGLNLRPEAIETLMRRTFDATFIAAALVLLLALGLTPFLNPGRGTAVHRSAIAGLEE